jgi:AGZA family xanthine/uracil permease-like MFS transporter
VLPLCLGYVLKVFQTPELALLPSIVILALYSSHLRLPLRLPAGLLCVMVGVLLVALLKAMYLYHLPPPPPITPPGFYPPLPVNLFPFLWHQDGWKFLSVIIPMSVLDTIVSLQVLESVKVAGDDYPTRPSLLVNGIATLIAAGFGSAFPTTLYFGHMAHKAIGARVGYSIINGVVTMVICLSGLIPLVLHFMPIEVVTMIVVWFGLVMIGQAFTEIPKAHAVAVAFGLLPMLASWAVELIDLAVRKAGSNLMLTAPLFGDELAIYGLIALSQGALLVSMLWAASLVYLSERRFLPAAGWLFAGSTLSFFGIIHAFSLTANGVENKIGFAAAPSFAFSYALAAAFLVGCHYYHRSFPALTPEPDAISGG